MTTTEVIGERLAVNPGSFSDYAQAAGEGLERAKVVEDYTELLRKFRQHILGEHPEFALPPGDE